MRALALLLMLVAGPANATVIELTKVFYETEVSARWGRYLDGRPQPQPPGTYSTERFSASFLNDLNAKHTLAVHTQSWYGAAHMELGNSAIYEAFGFSFSSGHDATAEPGTDDVNPREDPEGGYVEQRMTLRFKAIGDGGSLRYNPDGRFWYGTLHDLTANVIFSLGDYQHAGLALLGGHKYQLVAGMNRNSADDPSEAQSVHFDGVVVRVPEPGTLVLLSVALAGLIVLRRRATRLN